MQRKSKGDREEASRRERSLRQRQDEKIQQERRRARSCWIFRWKFTEIHPHLPPLNIPKKIHARKANCVYNKKDEPARATR